MGQKRVKKHWLRQKFDKGSIMQLHDTVFEVKDVSATGAFSGYGNVYGVVDACDDVVAPNCFADSLAEWTSKGRMPALLWQHNTRQPIGTYTAMREDARGLYVEGKLALKTQQGAEAYELLKMGAISGLSIGFQTREDSCDPKTGIRTIKRADLYECSLVTFPMNDSARVDAVKAIESIGSLSDAEAILREARAVSRSQAKALVSRIAQLARRDAAPASGNSSEADAQRIVALLAKRWQA